MKTLITVIVIALTAFTARASEEIPYIAMPVGIGYAVDAKGVRHPNAFCLRDAVLAPHPKYPYHSKSWESRSSDPGSWTRNIQGNGLYRIDIDLNTGHVSRVTIIKSAGSKILDAASTDTFKRWVFRPGKWREITVPITVRTKWVGVINRAGG
jgi:TonB family protein